MIETVPVSLFMTLYPYQNQLPVTGSKHLVICRYANTNFARVTMGQANNKIAINDQTGGYIKAIYGIKNI